MSDNQTSDLTMLVDAVWQVLDDMGADRTSCCLVAKAQLRVAFEPFRHHDMDMDMQLEAARAVLREVGLL